MKHFGYAYAVVIRSKTGVENVAFYTETRAIFRTRALAWKFARELRPHLNAKVRTVRIALIQEGA